MIKYINPQKLLTTDQFVNEPVNEISKILNENSSKRIILNGGRGTGKSTILYNMENISVGTDKPIIYTQFDSVINFSVTPNNIFDKIFFEHYYELCFSWNLLNFIEKNYFINYEKYFKDIETLLKSISKEFDKSIRNIRYHEILLNRYLFSKEIASEIIKRFKKYLSPSSFTLIIDRFDWINGRSAFSQQILKKYFDLFDKTIITSDDEKLNDANTKKLFEEKGYSVTTANYGNNLEIVKNIIKKRIQLHNQNTDTYFNVDNIDDVIYKNLIYRTNGNLSLMLSSMNEVINLFEWHDRKTDIIDLFDLSIEKELNKSKQLKKISSPPKLYL